MADPLKSCATCEHCDTDEAITNYAGICTEGLMVGEFVPEWVGRGCPDYTPREDDDVPQS